MADLHIVRDEQSHKNHVEGELVKIRALSEVANVVLSDGSIEGCGDRAFQASVLNEIMLSKLNDIIEHY